MPVLTSSGAVEVYMRALNSEYKNIKSFSIEFPVGGAAHVTIVRYLTTEDLIRLGQEAAKTQEA